VSKPVNEARVVRAAGLLRDHFDRLIWPARMVREAKESGSARRSAMKFVRKHEQDIPEQVYCQRLFLMTEEFSTLNRAHKNCIGVLTRIRQLFHSFCGKPCE